MAAMTQARAAELAEEVEWLLGGGSTAEEIAERLGYTIGSLGTYLTRAGRADLAKPFWQEANWRKSVK